MHSTSHIEGVWSTLKGYIKRIYNKIPSKNFILFLRESELRYIFSKLDNKEKEDKIIEIFKYLNDSSEFDLYTIEELNDNNNYDW